MRIRLILLILTPDEWICYPAKVGKLLIMVYFHLEFFDLGFSMCNLFQLADDTDLQKKPDALFIYGVPGNSIDGWQNIQLSFVMTRKTGFLLVQFPTGLNSDISDI